MARVRKLAIHARRLARENFSGDYHSSFRGQGLDFDEFREYQPGDEPRFIDWNVSARMQKTYVRKFKEERELTVILAIDISGSTDFGSDHFSKRERAAELTALLGFSARYNGDKVGLLLFAGEPILYIPPHKGGKSILRAVREVLATESPDNGTSLRNASEFLTRTLKKKGLIFFISDFIDQDWEKSFAALAARNEVIALSLTDPVERALPDVGKVLLRDPESGEEVLVNTSNANVRMGYEKIARRYRENLRSFFNQHTIDHLEVSSDSEDYLPRLHALFKQRAKSKR